MVPDRFAPVLDELAPLAERFAAAGHRLYLVGGAVRDLLLGVDERGRRPRPDDRPPGRRRSRRCCAAGPTRCGRRASASARSAPAATGRTARSLTVEITTFRGERYDDDSRKPEVTFADTIEADLARRDFTINAMALELGGGDVALVDPHGGAADLATATLRTPLSPEVSLRRRPAAHAARRPLHRPLRPDAGARAGRRRARAAASAWRSCRWSASATSSTS